MRESVFCSVVIPTIGRETVARSVQSVLDQKLPAAEFEVIVVNDSGQSLPDAEWQKSDRVRILHTNRRERCFARNCGAAIAKGKYLWFLDDDDWILPDALKIFWDLAEREKEAIWLYGGIRIVDGAGTILAEVNSGLNGNCFAQIMGGAWAPIQASLIKTKEFFGVGGFKIHIMGTEDLDLCRRIALKGDFANISEMVACLFRGETWSTSTNYLRAPEDTKLSRNELLSEPGAFKRMVSSAHTSYWYGRILRVYLSTISWNLRQRRLFSAVSRTFYAAFSLIAAGRHLFSADYWRAVRADHVPDTLHFVMKSYEQDLGMG